MPTCRIYNNQGMLLKTFDPDVFGSKGTFWVGRSPECEVSLNGVADRNVSRQHIQFLRKNGQWVVLGKGRSGLVLNGEPVKDSVIQDDFVYRFSQLFLCIGETCGPTGYECTWEALTEDRNNRAVLWPGINTIGASRDNSVTVRTEDVSRIHAKITVTPKGTLYLAALYRGRYTAINGNVVPDGNVEFFEGDEIQLGETVVVVKKSLKFSSLTSKSIADLHRQVALNRQSEMEKESGGQAREPLNLKRLLVLLGVLLVLAAFAVFLFLFVY